MLKESVLKDNILKDILTAIQKEEKMGFNNAGVFGGFNIFVLSKLKSLGEDQLTQGPWREIKDFFRNYTFLNRLKRGQGLEQIKKYLENEHQALQLDALKHAPEVKPNLPISAGKLAVKAEKISPTTSQATPGKSLSHIAEIKNSAKRDILSKGIQYVRKVGPERAKLLEALGITEVRDLLYYFPRDYEDRRNIKEAHQLTHGEKASYFGVVTAVQNLKPRAGLTITKAAIQGKTGRVFGVWFNQPFVKKQLAIGKTVLIFGKVDQGYGPIQISVEDFELISDDQNLEVEARIEPIYPATGRLSSKHFKQIISNLLLELDNGSIEEFLPGNIVKQEKLMDFTKALKAIHAPEELSEVKSARKRFVFEELFFLQVAILLTKVKEEQAEGIKHQPNGLLMDQFTESLPYRLTKAQSRVLKDIYRDMESDIPMHRLIQGDVGSGKTLVAVLALLKAIDSGYQGALMAPTEILAEQHYLSLKELLEPFRIRVELLTGSQSKKEKERLYHDLANGDIDLIIGTHALIQGDVVFKKLSLVVIDEQHRFGVKQRSTLQEKGLNPDVLVMTATPIPRSLALTLYGDLDVSVIDELPPGRTPIKTYWINKNKIPKLTGFVKEEIQAGRQAYVVCPLVEESEKIDLESATELAELWQREYFPEYRVGLLHGRMKAKEKEAIMEEFRLGKIHILVSTTVIEVGVNVPNATVMVIHDAERFGLAQLHQLRGRVGRGQHASYCFLISDTRSEEGTARMKIMQRSSDGFVLAEEDLKLRGPGDFFGTKQSGLPEFKIANLLLDYPILEKARKAAEVLLRNDPNLESPENQQFKKVFFELYKKSLYFINIG